MSAGRAALLVLALVANWSESAIEAPGPQGPLAGTLLAPAAANAPLVVIIPGSGPVDRDGNGPTGLNAGTYKLLAEGLAEAGVASLRIDKRGMFGSKAAVADANAVTIGDYAADVKSWTTALRRRSGASCVWLLGHSEGALVALAAARDAPDLCGLVLVSAAGRRIAEVIREQIAANPANAPIAAEASRALASIEAGKRYDTAGMSPALLPLFRPQVQDFLIDEQSYDPAELLRRVGKPVLIVQGQRDIQVGEKDALRLKDAAPAARLVLVPDANHVLKQVTSDDRRANIATYLVPDLPLAPAIVPAIAHFIKGQPPL
jgi:pimeloyl-ACP methyl ester carboxylesterase